MVRFFLLVFLNFLIKISLKQQDNFKLKGDTITLKKTPGNQLVKVRFL